VERQVKDRADAIAARAGLSTSELISQLINNIELTEQGIPTWMPPVTRDGELPIDPA
jgi:antitoxin component of RelBE/YafQ-DinJ toxin-antitoxin module